MPTRVESAPRAELPEESRILVLLGTYIPGYKAGGPIRSVENLVSAVGRELHFWIATLDRDFGDRLPFPSVVRNRWVRVGDANVMYLRPGLSGFFRMYALLRSADSSTVLYLNSFFSRRFSVIAVLMRWLGLSRPRCLVVALRGEFSPGALRFKRRRKRLYIRISQWFGLHQGILWHASSAFEIADIRREFPLAKHIEAAGIILGQEASRRYMGESMIATAPDIAGRSGPWPRERPSKVSGQLRAVFVGRCSPMKNVSGALRMLRGVSGNVSLDIYGPTEDMEYWKECQSLIAALPENIRVRYCGEIEHERVGRVLAAHELLLFPTLGENFGHVIAEAFLAECPVLTSDQTPWRGLEVRGVGWDIPLSEPERFRQVLQRCVDMGPEEHTELCWRAAEFGAGLANDPTAIKQNLALFRLAFAMPCRADALAPGTR